MRKNWNGIILNMKLECFQMRYVIGVLLVTLNGLLFARSQLTTKVWQFKNNFWSCSNVTHLQIFTPLCKHSAVCVSMRFPLSYKHKMKLCACTFLSVTYISKNGMVYLMSKVIIGRVSFKFLFTINGNDIMTMKLSFTRVVWCFCPDIGLALSSFFNGF